MVIPPLSGLCISRPPHLPSSLSASCPVSREYCNDNGLKPLSTADFGKVIKQVYPQVRPRRLGTRGNSRYCYAGLRKRVKLEQPYTPDCMTEGRQEEKGASSDHLEEAASYLILEWVEKLFNEKMGSMRDLALFLIDKMYVDNRSAAAHALLASAAKEHQHQHHHQQQQHRGRKANDSLLSPDGIKEDAYKRKTEVGDQWFVRFNLTKKFDFAAFCRWTTS